MKTFRWNPRKNEQLKADRGVSFEDIVFAIETGGLLDIVKHPNATRYPNQGIFVVAMGSYVYLVPHIGSGVCFSESDYSRSQGNARVRNEGKAMKALDREEKQILSAFEAEKLKSTVT